MPGTITLATTVKAPADEVFEILSTTEGQRAFWTADCDVGATHATFRFAEAPVDLEVSVTSEPHVLVRMKVESGFPYWDGSTWEWALSPVDGHDGETEIQFRHYGFGDGYSDNALGHTAQSWAMILHHLSNYVTSQSPDPFFKLASA
jgi:uncharacterized protein YndB with AHSA1/START domain